MDRTISPLPHLWARVIRERPQARRRERRADAPRTAAATEVEIAAAQSRPDNAARHRTESVAQQPRYVGLVTRLIAFMLDAAVINLVAIVVAMGAALILSLLHLSKDVKTVIIAIGGIVYILWSIGYFVGFWSATGQTPGNRAMQIRVVPTTGERLKPRRALVRVIGLVLAALPLCAGYVPILFDSRQRGLQDYLARTLVVEAPALTGTEQRRARRRSGSAATP